MNKIWSTLGKGLMAILPISLTIFIIYWIGASAEAVLGGILQAIVPALYVPGMGLIAGIGLLYVVGTLVNAWGVQQLFERGDRWLERIPLIKTIYGGIRDLARFLTSEEAEKGFGQVVVVTFEERIKLIGFVTSSELPLISEENAEDPLVGVYLPMSYQIGGYALYLPRSRLQPIDMPIEDAMRFVVTAGMSVNRSQINNARTSSEQRV